MSDISEEAISLSIASNSIKLRQAGLQQLQQRFEDPNAASQDLSSFAEHLFRTHDYYIDRKSRKAVTSLLLNEALYQPDTTGFIKLYAAECRKSSLAPSNEFVLLDWGTIMLKKLAISSTLFSGHGIVVASALARPFESLMSPTTVAKKSLRLKARILVEECMKVVVSRQDLESVKAFIAGLISKDQGLGSRACPIIGAIASACRLDGRAIDFCKPAIYDFYANEVLSARNSVPSHLTEGLRAFFMNYTTLNDLLERIVPVLKKFLLRSPEVILEGVFVPLIHSLPSSIDLSKLLADDLLKPLLSSAKSQREEIRTATIAAFAAMAERSQVDGEMTKINECILKALWQAKAAPERHCLAQMAQRCTCANFDIKSVLTDLNKLMSREANEAVLESEISLFFQLIGQIKDPKPHALLLEPIVATGCQDKRPGVRKLWLMGTGSFLDTYFQTHNDDPSVEPFWIDSLLPGIVASFQELIVNPLLGIQNGTIVSGFILVRAWQRIMERSEGSVSALITAKRIPLTEAVGSKVSFLLCPRIYARLSHDEFMFLLSALEASSSQLLGRGPDIQESWGCIFIYAVSCANLSVKTRSAAAICLSRIVTLSPQSAAPAVQKAIWAWVSDTATAKQSVPTASKLIHKGLDRVIRLITPHIQDSAASHSEEVRARVATQLVSLLVLCQEPIIEGSDWIRMCLRMGQDPGKLVSKYLKNVWQTIDFHLTAHSDPLIQSTRIAVSNSIAQMAFVNPDAIMPGLLLRLGDLLSSADVEKFSALDIAISKAPEGTAFVDVSKASSSAIVINKNTQDYAISQWEAEVRKSVAQKRGQNVKLSSEEIKKLEAQISKESSIRITVKLCEQRIRQGSAIVVGLANGPPTEITLWLQIAIANLLKVIACGCGRFCDSVADDAFIACSRFVTTRLGAQCKLIGIVTLRLIGSHNIPDDFCQESAQSMALRLLQRIHFLASQRPFDIATLIYILPLLTAVLHQEDTADRKTNSFDEGIVLSLEVVEMHTACFSERSLPRERVLQTLLEIMPKFTQHYKTIRDCIGGIVQALAPTIQENELSVLLSATIAPDPQVRMTTLVALRDYVDLSGQRYHKEIWISCFDEREENADVAGDVWEESRSEMRVSDYVSLLPCLTSIDKSLRSATAQALSNCIGNDQDVFTEVLKWMKANYVDFARLRKPMRDAFGMTVKTDLKDPWQARHGIALGLNAMSSKFSTSTLSAYVEFLITSGALGDRNDTVRSSMIESGVSVISLHGRQSLEELMAEFEKSLDRSSENATVQADMISEAVVILYGSLARHLPAGDDRLPSVVRRLLSTLGTPSETVQYAVAKCLPSLVHKSRAQGSEYIEMTTAELFDGTTYAVRRGAAYGLAGIVCGMGISALRESRVLSRLKAALENKKLPNQRQGALFAYEIFPLMLNRLFEPYTIQIVPQLLASFGDTSKDVRDACLDATKSCFSYLTSFGVKIVLPILLDGLDDTQWRSKKGACDMLGAMAYLDPQQLALSLPEIIPPLTTVLSDSHKEVRAAGNRSLQRFGDVISNPEIKSLVGILLKALSDPTKYTDDALDALIKVSFVHYLDSPSLALIVRILERGLSDRSATKRKAAQIIGSLAHLTEKKDVTTYLPVLVSGLRQAIVDPVPATRATASKALGSLVEKLGEDSLPDLIPSLMSTLKSDTGAGDRLGSAQALSEVLAGLGTSRLEVTLPAILQNVSSSRPSVREGFMTLFIYLPACFGNSFAIYLNKVIPPILAGLADDIEAVRETALRAGRLLVKNFATKAIDLLLPELDRGLADDNHRIRLSSVELVGDLLFNLTGVNSKSEQEDIEMERPTTDVGSALLEVLGQDKRDKILSSLFICRCDTSGLVRTAAINVWKILVASPRTLKELIPALSQLIIRRLASSNVEHMEIASNALGEMIKKAGEGVLSNLLPTLEADLLASTDPRNRQGICIALREIITSSTPEALEDYEKTLISIVRVALVDSDHDVRDAAAEAFDALQNILGKKAIDQVTPHLLSLLRTSDGADTALSALLTLLTDNTRSNVILPNLIPTLLKPPITSFNAKAIAALAEVSGPAINRRLTTILGALMDSLLQSKDENHKIVLEECFESILLSADELDGLNQIMSVMLSMVKAPDHHRRANANYRLAHYFTKSTIEFSRYYPELIRVLLLSFDDSDQAVVMAAWTALSTLTKRLKKEEMETLVATTRQTLQQVGTHGACLAGFRLPKGINAILPIFLQGLMNGTSEQRVGSALAIAEIADRCDADALKPFVTQITGPLIRVVSERSTDVKAAILSTLNNLLEKIPLLLKPFLPQLQRTFAKCLADPSSEVLRARAAKALGTLITMSPRVDPLIAELITGTKSPDLGVRGAMIKALFEVVSKAGASMSEASRNSILALIDGDRSVEGSEFMITHARLFGALVKSLPSSKDQISLVKGRALSNNPDPQQMFNFNAVLLEAGQVVLDSLLQETIAMIHQGIQHKSPIISDNAVLAAGKCLLLERPFNDTDMCVMAESLAHAVASHRPVDTRRLALVVIRTVGRLKAELLRPHLNILEPPVFASVRDPVIPIKLAAEAAYITLFDVADSENQIFDEYITQVSASLPPGMKRSKQDYFKRVATRLGAQARDRRGAEGGQGGLGLTQDERDDEAELWSVGKVDLGQVFGESEI